MNDYRRYPADVDRAEQTRHPLLNNRVSAHELHQDKYVFAQKFYLVRVRDVCTTRS